MMRTDFMSLVKPDQYQVFLCTCPARLPFSFAPHPWFVVNNRGVLSRFEVSFTRLQRDLSMGHLNKNLLPLFAGIEMLPRYSKLRWVLVTVHGVVEGGAGSLAERMVECIEHSFETYLF